MTKIYLIRHGESIANTLGIYQGQTYDTDLSLLGQRQALALRDYFLNIPIGALFASPVTRTRKTAKEVALATGIPQKIDPRLLETNHGQWEGLSKQVIQTQWGDLLGKWQTDPIGVVFPGGESFAALNTRVIAWWNQIKLTKTNTVIVTHDNFIRVLVSHLLQIPHEHFWQFNLDPAGVTTIILENGKVTLQTLNNYAHLNSCLTNLALHAL